LNLSTIPSGAFEGTNVPKWNNFSSMKNTFELINEVI
jgi:hypothetical protein